MQAPETISITMPPELLRAVEESVASGEYASPSDVLRDAVQLWQRRRAEDAARLDTIRARIRRSLDDPRPNLTVGEVRESIAALHAETLKAHRREAS